ncbi:MAG: hypothetical protein ACXWQR_19805 [Ktedonobacterales bacterium]
MQPSWQLEAIAAVAAGAGFGMLAFRTIASVRRVRNPRFPR